MQFRNLLTVLDVFIFGELYNKNEKKRSDRRKHCALAVVRWSQKISPRTRPPTGGAGRPKFNQLEMVTTFTYKPSLVKIDARNFELSWQQTHKHTHTQTNKQTHRQDRLQYTAPLSLARSVNIMHLKICLLCIALCGYQCNFFSVCIIFV